ncbi:MAG TPA: hypothetical protein GXX29_05710 [Firmicutes bacterium]|nr:hypothetical protein [Bacillota bacterium]
MAEPIYAEYFFDLSGWSHASIFKEGEPVWQALERLPEYLAGLGEPVLLGTVEPGAWVGEKVYLAEGALVQAGAMVCGPAYIGPGSVIRHGAYVRENCLIGADCVVGHCSETKGCIMLDGAQAPHFNYVGDSILGRKVNLGAGTKLSNLKNDRSEITVTVAGTTYATGRKKLGAIIGDRVAVGCNAVTSPGTLIGPNSSIYANVVVRGFVPALSIVKLRQTQEIIPMR